MTIIRAIENIKKLPHPVLTIGNFDGVHLGHQALFNKVKERAREKNGTSMVMTFEPHPMRVMKKNEGLSLITLYEQKLELMGKQDMDVIICLDFSTKMAQLSAEDFVRELLVDKIGVKRLIIGYDFRFGHKGKGDADLLTEMGKEYDFEVEIIGPQYASDGQVISSTRIREMVRAGDVESAPKFLGRYYRIMGRVVRGKDRGGKLLGFPTANIKLVDELVPLDGVYAVEAIIKGKVYGGVANIGYNPTFGDVGLSVEVHCFDFNEDIYDTFISVEFKGRIRGEKKFSGIDELKAHIKADCEIAKEILAKTK